MQATLAHIDEKYGSLAAYLRGIDFDDAWQARLRDALTGP
jgi:hypothetical protein